VLSEGSPGDNEFASQILQPIADEIFSELNSLLAPRVPQSASTNDNGSIKDDAENPPLHKSSSDSTNSALSEGRSIACSSSYGSGTLPPSTTPLALQLFYTGEDPICDHVLESLGQADADLPLVVLVNSLLGHIAICGNPDVSTEVVTSFISDYREGRASIVPIVVQPTNVIILYQ